MIQFFRENIFFFQTLILWVFIGIFLKELVYIIIPLFLIYFNKEEKYIEILIGLLFILTLSDSRQGELAFAAVVKTFYILLFFYFFLSDKSFFSNTPDFYKNFIPFFIVAFYCLFYSETLLLAFQKTVSYLLLVILVPTYLSISFYQNKEKTLQMIIYFGALILFSGILLRFILPDFVYLQGRFSGILGNPNGMGIFCLLYGITFFIITKYHSYLFSKKARNFIKILIFISLILSSSRGGIISLSLFLFFSYFSRMSNFLSVIIFIFILISYQIIVSNATEIVIYFALEDYFRLETLEAGAGRLVAFQFAWENIQENFYFGKGFSFSEFLFFENREALSILGHQGLTHNAYLSIWLDTGLIGLLFFLIAWGKIIASAMKNTYIALPIVFGVLFSTNIETWLSASLNPFTIQLLIIFTLLNEKYFFKNEK